MTNRFYRLKGVCLSYISAHFLFKTTFTKSTCDHGNGPNHYKYSLNLHGIGKLGTIYVLSSTVLLIGSSIPASFCKFLNSFIQERDDPWSMIKYASGVSNPCRVKIFRQVYSDNGVSIVDCRCRASGHFVVRVEHYGTETEMLVPEVSRVWYDVAFQLHQFPP